MLAGVVPTEIELWMLMELWGVPVPGTGTVAVDFGGYGVVPSVLRIDDKLVVRVIGTV